MRSEEGGEGLGPDRRRSSARRTWSRVLDLRREGLRDRRAVPGMVMAILLGPTVIRKIAEVRLRSAGDQASVAPAGQFVAAAAAACG